LQLVAHSPFFFQRFVVVGVEFYEKNPPHNSDGQAVAGATMPFRKPHGMLKKTR